MDRLALVILNLAAISALFYLFDFPYRRYRERALRDRIFAIRDELFCKAELGLIAFDAPAYVMTRRMLNGMIRFAHTVSLWRIIIMVGTEFLWASDDFRSESKRYVEKHYAVVDQLSEPARSVVKAAMFEAHLAVISHVMYTSLIFFPLAVITKYLMHMFIRVRANYQEVIGSKLLQPANTVLDREAFLAGC
ncbi:MAG TPA: hypothetical protein VME42_11425 [Steroidobacteraceae bacterium]|nr:hypothetical protein [Steroidobacteraceae bacterium]